MSDANKDVGLQVNTEKTKYMLLSRHQNAGQNHDIKIGNRCFENVAQFRSLGTTTCITNQNLIQDKIEKRLNLGNIQFTMFCLLICCLKTQKLKYKILYFCLGFCMGTKLCL
jgi:hypothetical protein